MSLNFTFVLQIFSFLILLALLTRFLYKPLLNYLDKRARDLQDLIETAGKDRKKSEEYLESSKEELRMAKEEVLQMKESAAREADREKIMTLEEARKEALLILNKAERDVKKEIEKAKAEAARDIGSLSVAMAKKILEREVSEKDHKKLITQALKELNSER